MKKREFMEQWKAKREHALHSMYKNDPHGAACLAMSLVDVPLEGERLWRKYRASLRSQTAESFFADTMPSIAKNPGMQHPARQCECEAWPFCEHAPNATKSEAVDNT